MRNQCRKIPDLVSLYVDDKLEIDEKQGLIDHLRSCSKCRQICNDFCAIYDQNILGREHNFVPIPDSLHETIVDALKNVHAEQFGKTLVLPEAESDENLHIVQYRPGLNRRFFSYIVAALAVVLVTSGGIGAVLGQLQARNPQNSSISLKDMTDDEPSVQAGRDNQQLQPNVEDNRKGNKPTDRAISKDSGSATSVDSHSVVSIPKDITRVDVPPDVSTSETASEDQLSGSTEPNAPPEKADQNVFGIDSYNLVSFMGNLSIPAQIAGESFAFCIVSKSENDIDLLSGEKICKDETNNISYVKIKNNISDLSAIIMQLEKAGSELSMVGKIENLSNESAEYGLVVIMEG